MVLDIRMCTVICTCPYSRGAQLARKGPEGLASARLQAVRHGSLRAHLLQTAAVASSLTTSPPHASPARVCMRRSLALLGHRAVVAIETVRCCTVVAMRLAAYLPPT